MSGPTMLLLFQLNRSGAGTGSAGIVNNNLLFNAAMNGCLAGAQQRPLVDPVALDYAASANAAAAFATRVDSKIPFDVTISGAGGSTLPPASAAISANQQAKVNLLTDLCTAVWIGRYPTSLTPADYDAMANGVVGAYTQAVATLVTQGTLS